MTIESLVQLYDTQLNNYSHAAMNCICDDVAFERYKEKIEELQEEFKKNVEILGKESIHAT